MKTGDRVICVDVSHSGASMPLILNREYIVYGVSFCQICQAKLIDVGFINEENHILRCRCDSTLGVSGETRLFYFSRFRKVEEQVNYVKLEVEIEEPCLN